MAIWIQVYGQAHQVSQAATPPYKKLVEMDSDIACIKEILVNNFGVVRVRKSNFRMVWAFLGIDILIQHPRISENTPHIAYLEENVLGQFQVF